MTNIQDSTRPVGRRSRNRWRRYLTALSLLLGITTALVGLAPVASAKPAPVGIESCSGNCGPCPQGVTWHTVPGTFGLIYVGYVYVIRSSTPTFYPSDARQVSNGLSTPITVTVSSQTSRTHTVTTTVGFSADLLKVLHTSVSVSIVNTTTTAIGVTVQATVAPFSSILAEYGMHGYDIVYDATQYITTKSDLPNNVCGAGTPQYNLTTVGPTIVEGWRITSV
jgi:hypothetical protein